MSDCIPPRRDPFADPMKPNPTCPVCTFPLLCVMCTAARAINTDGTAETEPLFVLTENEMRAIVRQTLHQYIPTEGTSGPVLSAVLVRIREHVGYAKYNEFCAEPMKGGKHG